MKIKINRELLPIKAHYFFFFAALGPLLPQMNVFGRQLGISPSAMGLVTAVLPLLWALAKPIFGFIVDYFTRRRKLIFMSLIVLMTSSFCGLWLVQQRPAAVAEYQEYQIKDVLLLDKIKNESSLLLEKYVCHWNCEYQVTFQVFLANSSSMDTLYLKGDVTNATCEDMLMNFSHLSSGKVACVPKKYCDFFCHRYSSLRNCLKTDNVHGVLESGVLLNPNCTEFEDINQSIVEDVKDEDVPINRTKPNLNKTDHLNSDKLVNETKHEKANVVGVIDNKTIKSTDVKLDIVDKLSNISKNYVNETNIASDKKLNDAGVDKNHTKNDLNKTETLADINLVEHNNDTSVNTSKSNRDVKENIITTENHVEADLKTNKLIKRQSEKNESYVMIKSKNNSIDNLKNNKTENITKDEDEIRKLDVVNKDYMLPPLIILCHTKSANDSVETDAEWDEVSLYTSFVFWWFVILMCVGTVAFNVANCIGDAICFDVLGPQRASRYGAQRAWGTVGYGVTALLGGWLVDRASAGSVKDFAPAFILAIVFTVLDLFSCRPLKLPPLSSPKDGGKALLAVLRIPSMMVFIVFAAVIGTFDSFIIYYMFWFLEELAETTGHMAKIKLIEGIVVAAESFVGELLFFFFSGKIIKRWGYSRVMSFCMFCYGARLFLISLITNPWQLVLIEGVMQGPTYALCYSCIVGLAATAAPPGYSATVQGLLAGVDDGLGFSIGSLVGGLVYGAVGGRAAFQIMALVAVVAAVLHAILTWFVGEGSENKPPLPLSIQEEGVKMLPVPNTSSDIYNETVMPLKASIDT